MDTVHEGGVIQGGADVYTERSCAARTWQRRVFSRVAAIALLLAVPCGVAAHHGGHRMSVPSAKCGFIDGEDLRDRRHLADFCARWVPTDLQVRSASALRERLWIEAPAEVAFSLRYDSRSTTALLKEWLEHWKKTTGYETASVALVRDHREVARIQTTMKGDVVVIP